MKTLADDFLGPLLAMTGDSGLFASDTTVRSCFFK